MQSGVTEPLARTVTLPATKKDKGQLEDTRVYRGLEYTKTTKSM